MDLIIPCKLELSSRFESEHTKSFATQVSKINVLPYDAMEQLVPHA